jgi:hypothetical protein
VQDQVSEVLRAVTDHFPKQRYLILKERLRKHLAWLEEHEASVLQLQRMIDLLSTHGDYEKELVPLLEKPRNTQISFGAIGRLFSSPQSTSNQADRPEIQYMNLKPLHIDDAEFLADICLLRDQHSAYEQIAEEIIQEATESLGAKLKRLSQDIAYRAEWEIGRLLQEVSYSFAEQRLHAEKMANLELVDLIRKDLDEEPRHPTDLYVYDSSH